MGTLAPAEVGAPAFGRLWGVLFCLKSLDFKRVRKGGLLEYGLSALAAQLVLGVDDVSPVQVAPV